MQSEDVIENKQKRADEIKHVEQTTCCIVGGGPAGVVLAYLLARKGISVTLLEAHMDFEREFRGDTIHPSILNIMDELGLAERLLQIPHTELHELSGNLANGPLVVADFRRLKVKYPFVAMLPQANFLAFMVEEARRYPTFRLVMGVQADELIEEDGRVCGVRCRGNDGRCEVRAVLTVGADGRFSRIRKLAGFDPIKTSPPMDVLWFRLSYRPDDPHEPFGSLTNQHILVMLNRYDYWQGGYVIAKGKYQEIRAAGLEAFRREIAEAIPWLGERVHEIREWKQVSVLSVESSRVTRWYKPGLLLLGDAAHVMSPVGGVGINYAIQDAVVAANELSSKLLYGVIETGDLARVQRKRELPTRIIQSIQMVIQNAVLARALTSTKPLIAPPWLRLLLRIPGVRSIPPRIIGLGIVPVHVKDR